MRARYVSLLTRGASAAMHLTLVQVLSLLVGAAGQQISAQPANAPERDPERLTVEEQFDDITQFDPFADQLKCHGCKFVSKALQSGLDSKFARAFKKLKKPERIKASQATLSNGCKLSPDLPERVIRIGNGYMPNSTKEFLDQGEQWRIDPTGKFVNVKALDLAVFEYHDAAKLKLLCRTIAKDITQEYVPVVNQLAARSRKGTLTGFNISRALCYEHYKVCKLLPHEKFEEEEEDDDDDDREL